MITETEAIEVANKYRSFHAKKLLSIRLESCGETDAYHIQYGHEDGELQAEIVVNAGSGEVLKTLFYDLEVFESEDLKTQALERENEVKAAIRGLLKRGDRVAALKLWRKSFPGTLGEAQNAIEALME